MSDADGLILPAPCLVVLMGPSGAGKSTWAATHFAANQIVSSDALRAAVGEGEDDLRASTDAFALLESIVAARLNRRLTTVIDTLGMEPDRRRRWIALARRHDVTPIAVAFSASAADCRARNRQRAKAVPDRVLTAQLATFKEQRALLEPEGFQEILSPAPVRTLARAMATTTALASVQRDDPVRLRFGLQVPVFTWPGGPAEIGPRLAAIGRAAEEVGFTSLWVMDHLRQIPLFGPPWHDMLESWTTLGFLAAATSTIRLGTMVSAITLRNVAHLGKIVATLDVLSGGRAACGLGLGWYAEEHAAYGIAFPSTTERYALLEDALQLLPRLWGPGSPRFDGAVLHVPEALCYPRPLQSRVPILVGGGGERRTLRLVARLADACNIVGEADVLRRKVAVLRQHLDEEGRGPDAVEVTQLATALVGRDAAEVAGLVELTRPRRTSADRWAARVKAGTIADHIGRFRGLSDAGVATAVVSFPDLGDTAAIERFGPVIAAFS